jgi:diaminopimelate decarboxylase
MILKTIDGKRVKPPYYLFDVNMLERDYQRLRNAFSTLYKKFIIAYSYKTNYVPYVCRVLHKAGAWAEVVSRLEYELASRLLRDTSKIIYNGPVKNYNDLETALNNQSLVNLDSFYEIDYLQKYCKKNPRIKVKTGVRVNFSPSKERKLPFKTSRFGFCFENGDLHRAFVKIKEIPNARISGLHAHFSTKSKSTYIFKEITSRLCEIALHDLKGRLEYIDIGGNLGSAPKEMPQLRFPTFEEYAHGIVGELKKHINTTFRPSLIIEPGISLIVQAFRFACNVVEIKKVRKKKFVVLDGSIDNIKPTKHPFNLPVKVYDHKGALKKGKDNTYQVAGYTCMENDLLLKDFQGPEIDKGDFFVFENVGAYTIVLKPPFIQPHPPIIARKNNRYKIIRRRETFRDFFSTYEL